MKIRYQIGMVCLLLASTVQAQHIEDVLQQIEQHNLSLQAQLQDTKAAVMEVQSANSLNDLSVSYSPFFAKNTDGVASSEFVVSQSFDFPTVYAVRHRSGKLQHRVLNWQQEAFRRNLLLEAKNLCLDMVLLNRKEALLKERKKNADELLELYLKRLEEGDAGILEVNKIKMERMNVQTEVAQNNAAHRTSLQSLLMMNGNHPILFSSTEYPEVDAPRNYSALYDEVMNKDADLQAAETAIQAAEKNLAVNRQNWLPKLEVGYRRNTALHEKNHGFLIGGSLPLFSNRKKVQIAKAQAVSTQLQFEHARLQAEAAVQSQFNEICQLQEAMQAYDVPLMYETLDMLKEAVMVGQLSIIDYYTEADNVYRNLQAYMELENQYQKLMAAVYKNRL